MLAAVDLPQEILDLHASVTSVAFDMFAALERWATPRDFRAEVDLLHAADPGLLMIDDGYLRLAHEGRTVRFFRDGDLVLVVPGQPASTRLTSDMLTRTRFVPKDDFQRALASSPLLLDQWTGYQEAQFQMMAAICAQYATDDQQLGMKLRNAKPGEVLIAQGQPMSEVYVLIDGAGDVFVDDIQVGSVRAGEFIGEMSFLTETTSGAKVVASEPCVVQVIDRNSFASVVRSRPHTMFVLARTLAERLARANRLSATSLSLQPGRPSRDPAATR